MRKNRMMRAASALLVAVLLTTSTISGTFAKYVTEASGSDTARVAKWGVEVSSFANTLFGTTYAKDYEDTSIANTVQATEDVVAPGTKQADGGVKFVITGTPEVAVQVEIKITDSAKTGEPVDVKLPAKNGYTDYTVATGVDADGKAVYGTFDLAKDYYPVKFYLKDGSDVIAEGTLADIKATIATKLANDYNSADGKPGQYGPGTDLKTILGGSTGVYTLTWEWVFNGNDAADTYLGNVAAGTVTDASAITKIDLAIEITVTQID